MSYEKSKMIEKLRNDELVTCTKINITDMTVAEIAAWSGFDCIWLDMEHIPSDHEEIRAAMLAAKARGAETIVRTSRGAYSNMIRLLEMDATGIMVPHVMNYKDAKEVVYYTKFHPIGRRPLDGGNADGKYCLMDFSDYLQYSNEEKLTIIQIEDVEAMEDLEKMAALEGIDMIFFGPGDFSQSIGCPGASNEEIEKARTRVAEVARKHGKIAGTVGSAENLPHLYELGYRFVSMGADVVGLGAYYQSILDKVKGFKEGR